MARKKAPSRHSKQQPESVPRRPLPVLDADPGFGLSQAQVQARLASGWSNDPGESPSNSEGQIIRENTLTFFNLIFLILAALLVIAGSYKNMMFLVIAIANTAIGTVQEIRSKRAVDKLSLVARRPVKVVRDGQVQEVPPENIVRDDLAEFGQGDQICGDGILQSGTLYVDESLLTGEDGSFQMHRG